MRELLLSETELTLAELIDEVGFGELYDVSLVEGPRTKRKRVREGTAQLIEFVRENGYADLEQVTIHEKDVKQIEVTGSKHEIRYKKKIRF